MSPVVGTGLGPRLKAPSNQFALVPGWVSAGDKSFTEDGQLFRRIVATKLHNFRPRKLVASFVIRMPGMTFEPLPSNVMPGCNGIELSP